MQDVVRCISLIFQLRLRLLDDMKLFQKGISMDLLERPRNLYELLKFEMEKGVSETVGH